MAKAKKSTGVALVEGTQSLATLGQADIPGMLKIVLAKIKELKGNMPETSKTTGILPGFDKKVKEIDTVEELIKAHSSIIGRAKAYNESAEMLEVNIEKFPFKLEGSTAEEWINDIKSTINIVKNKVALDKFEQVRIKLESNLSAKMKLAKDLEDCQNILID